MSNYLATFGKPRFLGIVALTGDELEATGARRIMVVESYRGEELAELVGPITPEQEKDYRSIKTVSEHGEGPVRGGDPVVTDLTFVRVPTDDDLREMEDAEAAGQDTLRAAKELIESNRLDVKLIDTEMLLGKKKLFFYFTAENRVDFRTLVKDLARHFRTRIELRQIGVRDEARIVKGLASCGRPCCCGSWLNRMSPIGIKMVKEQNIALNPSKISGICGRLMCCMAFEHKTYRELWTGLPGPGSKIKAPAGTYIVLSMDIAREAVRVHKPTGGDVTVPIKMFDTFRETVMRGEEWELPEDAISDYDRRKASAAAFVFGPAHDTFDFSMFEKASSSEDRRAQSDESGDAEEHRDPRRRRRRGRRGPKKPEGAAQEAAPKPQAREQEERPPRKEGGALNQHRRPRRRRPSGGRPRGEARGEEQ